MTPRRAATIAASVVATIVAVTSLLLIPLSLVVGHPQSALIEAALLVVSIWFVARVMRADRRTRLAAEAALPPERRPARHQPRQPITFQVRETLVTFALWALVVFGFDALVLAMDPLVNLGVTVFAAFMLATLTVSGRHMMFRLTVDEEDKT
jgi:hypothetical protein